MGKCLAGLAAGIVAVSAQAAAPGVTDEDAAALNLAISRATLLYAYDQAAWHGTDDIRARYPDLLAKAGGYVMTGSADETHLSFYDRSGLTALYRATFRGSKRIAAGPPVASETALSAEERALIGARKQAITAFEAANVGLCNKAQPNLTILPPSAGGNGFIAYLMTSQTSTKSLPLGGHYRVVISADGRTGPVRPFMKTCMEAPMLTRENAKSKPAAFAVTHLLDKVPTEVHVFSSLSASLPLYVITGDKRIWAVEGGRIRLVREDIVKGAKPTTPPNQ